MEMKKGLKSAQHSGSVHVTFNVSKDVASRIRQSAVSSWERMQDLGVVSVQLDAEQLVHANSELNTEMPDIQSTEFQHCTQFPCLFNGYTEPERCYKKSRGGRSSRLSGSRVAKRRRKDSSVYPCTSKELCSSTFTAASAVQEGMIYKIGDNASQRFQQNKELASLTSNEHVLPTSIQMVSSSQLLNYMSSNVTFNGTALSTDSYAVSTKNPFIANALHPKSDELGCSVTLNTMQSQGLPPPSTPFVPKRRKRRKPADSSSEATSPKAPSFTAVNYMQHTTLPLHVNGRIEAASNLCWQDSVNRRFQLNGHYPQQLNSPVFCQRTGNNAQLMPLSYAGCHSPVALANNAQLPAQLPAERQMVFDSRLTVSTGIGFSPTTSRKLENNDMLSVKGNVGLTAGSDQLLQLGANVSYLSHTGNHRGGQLRQPIVSLLSEACSPKLSNRFSQGSMELRHCNPETYGVYAETEVASFAENFSKHVNSQLCDCDVSSPVPTNRNLCSDISTSGLTLGIKPYETTSSLSFDINSLAPVLKSSETVSIGSIDMLENIRRASAVASAVSTTSVCSSTKSLNFVVESDVVHHSNRPVSSSAVVNKHKSSVMNGYHIALDCSPAEAWHASHMIAPSAVVQTVNEPNFSLSSASSNNADSKYDFQTAAELSSFTKPAPCNEASQTARALHSANTPSPCELAQSVNSIENNRTISG